MKQKNNLLIKLVNLIFIIGIIVVLFFPIEKIYFKDLDITINTVVFHYLKEFFAIVNGHNTLDSISTYQIFMIVFRIVGWSVISGLILFLFFVNLISIFSKKLNVGTFILSSFIILVVVYILYKDINHMYRLRFTIGDQLYTRQMLLSMGIEYYSNLDILLWISLSFFAINVIYKIVSDFQNAGRYRLILRSQKIRYSLQFIPFFILIFLTFLLVNGQILYVSFKNGAYIAVVKEYLLILRSVFSLTMRSLSSNIYVSLYSFLFLFQLFYLIYIVNCFINRKTPRVLLSVLFLVFSVFLYNGFALLAIETLSVEESFNVRGLYILGGMVAMTLLGHLLMTNNPLNKNNIIDRQTFNGALINSNKSHHAKQFYHKKYRQMFSINIWIFISMIVTALLYGRFADNLKNYNHPVLSIIFSNTNILFLIILIFYLLSAIRTFHYLREGLIFEERDIKYRFVTMMYMVLVPVFSLLAYGYINLTEYYSNYNLQVRFSIKTYPIYVFESQRFLMYLFIICIFFIAFLNDNSPRYKLAKNLKMNVFFSGFYNYDIQDSHLNLTKNKTMDVQKKLEPTGRKIDGKKAVSTTLTTTERKNQAFAYFKGEEKRIDQFTAILYLKYAAPTDYESALFLANHYLKSTEPDNLLLGLRFSRYAIKNADSDFKKYQVLFLIGNIAYLADSRSSGFTDILAYAYCAALISWKNGVKEAAELYMSIESKQNRKYEAPTHIYDEVKNFDFRALAQLLEKEMVSKKQLNDSMM